MKDKSKELLDRIKTREELEKRGYRRKVCPYCHGASETIEHGRCIPCGGEGEFWESPLMC